MMTMAILGYPAVDHFMQQHTSPDAAPYLMMFPGNPDQQAFYETMIDDGQSERLAEMLAFQSPPGLGLTRASFMKGRHDGGLGDPEVDAKYRSMANAGGVNPTGKVYSSSLASFPGDPEAWISSPSEAKEVAERKNLKLEGSISYTPTRYEAPCAGDDTEYVVAEDIVSDELEVQAQNNPELIDQWKAKPQIFEDAKEKTRKKLSGDSPQS